jgi:hypothetical protein
MHRTGSNTWTKPTSSFRKRSTETVHGCYGHKNSLHQPSTFGRSWMKVEDRQQPTSSSMSSLKRGEHHYLDGQQEKLWTWCKAISLQCKDILDALRDQPMPRAITYCGYSTSVSRREAQYKNRSSTTWLVWLVETTFRVLFPDRGFFLPLYPIAYLSREEELQLAERAFTRCTYSDFK